MDNNVGSFEFENENHADPDVELAKKREMVDSQYNESTGLMNDAINQWASLFYVQDAEALKDITPRQHYEEYYNSRVELEIADYVMQKSNPGAVTAHYALVDEFNSNLDRILQEGDTEAVREFYERANRLIRGEEEQ